MNKVSLATQLVSRILAQRYVHPETQYDAVTGGQHPKDAPSSRSEQETEQNATIRSDIPQMESILQQSHGNCTPGMFDERAIQ